MLLLVFRLVMTPILKTVAVLALAAGLVATPAMGEPALVYSVGGKFDGSFNEAAFRGAERFAAETGAPYRDFEIARDADSLQALRGFAAQRNTPRGTFPGIFQAPPQQPQ